MNPNDPNVFLLERAAEQFGEVLLELLVFVGGTLAGVLMTDPAHPGRGFDLPGDCQV